MSLYRNIVLIDTKDDHIPRSPLETSIIDDWIINNHSPGDEWYSVELESLSSRYGYCLCGHEIVTNCVVINNTKKIGFIVGSKCVDKFNTKNIIRIYNTKKICDKCGVPMPKAKKNICSECSKDILSFGKYKKKYFIDIFYQDRKYCEWFLTLPQSNMFLNQKLFYATIKKLIREEELRNQYK